jgi:hypothetical protein
MTTATTITAMTILNSRVFAPQACDDAAGRVRQSNQTAPLYDQYYYSRTVASSAAQTLAHRTPMLSATSLA